uniref:Pentraxin family member n=1 Tax=Sinocyclocheilus rhinocerous TaxID=307959 RepID=A0A673FPT4_9TELE
MLLFLLYFCSFIINLLIYYSAYETYETSFKNIKRSSKLLTYNKNLTQSLNKTVLFSYGTKKNPQELQLLLARHSVLLTVGGETHLVEAHSVVTDGQWGHFCAAWSSEQGLATLWVNGENVAKVPGVAEGHVLPGNGFILLGQERSRSGIYRDLDSSVAFTGKMTGVNMWDHMLEAGRIKEYANQDGYCDSRGNVIGWGVSEIIPHGGNSKEDF